MLKYLSTMAKDLLTYTTVIKCLSFKYKYYGAFSPKKTRYKMIWSLIDQEHQVKGKAIE